MYIDRTMENDKEKAPPSEVEHIKIESRYLRGTLEESLSDAITGGLRTKDVSLIKFHGSYQQSDRDLESERKRQKLEPLYSFMIRVRLPGGMATPAQFAHICDLSDKYGNGTVKITTRQAFQLHGVFKRNLKKTIATINAGLLDTIAACGDVNRNVMCNPLSELSEIHERTYDDACAISRHLTPRTNAYHEIWLDKEKITGTDAEEEPIYGKTYLPRKFKIALAIPPRNDVDIYANDLGFIAVPEKGKLTGYNVVAGGGMGMTFGNDATYPRLASNVGFIQREHVLAVSEEIVKIQRDNGNRSDRKIARLKYTIDRLGEDWFRNELETRLGWKLEAVRPVHFDSNEDQYGWAKTMKGDWHLTLFIEGGRIYDGDKRKLKTALKEIAAFHAGDFRLTGNQNLIIANIPAINRQAVNKILTRNGIDPGNGYSGLRLNSLACVALNTCPLAFAEAERYLPSLISKLESLLEEHKLEKQSISIRMTGCPNGCARPYLAEIGLVGKSIGHYNLYLGGNQNGTRINRLYRETLDEQAILGSLTPLFKAYAEERQTNEEFGDFVVRKGIV
jgi:sulfite reductase (NADPH) hemoprotein beta-component